MIHHGYTPVHETYNPMGSYELDYGQLLKEQAEQEIQKATDAIPRTVAHYASPSVCGVAFKSETVAEHMQFYGMDVIPIFGDPEFMYEWETDLGIILEHTSEINSDRFESLVDEITCCLHVLGWNYDNWVCEGVGKKDKLH